MAVSVNSNEILRLFKFLDQCGTSNMNEYRIVLNPGFKGLNLKVDLSITFLPEDKTITVTLDP